jgi:hypothetical protein
LRSSCACASPQSARLSQHLGGRLAELRWIGVGFQG